ncbi:acid phosphatase type 7 [Aplysia californica]|uniref:Purple acid phosphatase n=1 Tax=Aplysia californica TaxID=6500 RepID=A0ABM0K8Y3_APLCA|nr:acid phosphatase type 7 [Aplysia californica]
MDFLFPVREMLVQAALLMLVLSPRYCHEQEQGMSNSLSSQLINEFKNEYHPQHIHISFGAFPTDVVIMWSTKEDVRGYVEYMVEPNDLKRALGIKVNASEHGEHALKFIHRAELQDLMPDTTYTYRVVSEGTESGSASEELKFKVPHNDPKGKHTFMVVADMGLRANKQLHFVCQEVVNGEYEAVFHIGDIAYNLHTSSGIVGDQFMEHVEIFATKVPYMTTPGDHEKELQGPSPYYEYRYRFSMPNAPWPMRVDSLWYSLDIGQTHFVSINTETFLYSSPLRDTQFMWLKEDLIKANKNRKSVPWLIVMGHQPLYCSQSVMEVDCAKENSVLRGLLEDLFYEQGVDLYLSGHKHSYERTLPMYGGRAFQTDYVNPMAPVYIVNGAMGYEYMVDEIRSKHFWLPFAQTDGKKELFARLNVLDGTRLIWSARAAESNEEVDTIQIVQRNHSSFGNAGPDAFRKIEYLQKSNQNKLNNLPPEPFIIIDSPPSTATQYRTFILYVVVFALALILFMFLRNPRMRRILKI